MIIIIPSPNYEIPKYTNNLPLTSIIPQAILKMYYTYVDMVSVHYHSLEYAYLNIF